MNRDHALFAVVGLLAGFIAGYLAHEVMAARQPPLRNAGFGVGAADPHAGVAMPGGQVPAGPAAGGQPGAPALDEINRLRARLEQEPNDRDAILRLANMNFDIGSFDRAKELYERLIALGDAVSPDVLTDLGVCERELGAYDRALELFRQAQQLSPQHWQSVYNEVVVLAFDLKQLDAAGERVAALQQLQPGNPDIQRLADEIARRRAA